jgi:hypothetical protein
MVDPIGAAWNAYKNRDPSIRRPEHTRHEDEVATRGQVNIEPPAHSQIYSVLLNKVEVVGGDALSSDNADEVFCYGGKADRGEVRVIRGGGEASDTEQMWRHGSIVYGRLEVVPQQR